MNFALGMSEYIWPSLLIDFADIRHKQLSGYQQHLHVTTSRHRTAGMPSLLILASLRVRRLHPEEHGSPGLFHLNLLVRPPNLLFHSSVGQDRRACPCFHRGGGDRPNLWRSLQPQHSLSGHFCRLYTGL